MKYLIDGETLTNIADTIREISGTNAMITGADIASGLQGATANLIQRPTKGFIFLDYDQEGYPTTLQVDGLETIPASNFSFGLTNNIFLQHIKKIIISEGTKTIDNYAFDSRFNVTEIVLPTTITNIGNYAFRYCAQFLKSIYIPNTSPITINMGLLAGQSNVACVTERLEIKGDASLLYTFYNMGALKEVIIGGQVNNWIQVGGGSKVELYDFSGCNNIFALQKVEEAWLPHADGCIIRVKQNLLNEWKSSTNWAALPTDPNESGYVVWEGV